jgi:hypothetical protein
MGAQLDEGHRPAAGENLVERDEIDFLAFRKLGGLVGLASVAVRPEETCPGSHE